MSVPQPLDDAFAKKIVSAIHTAIALAYPEKRDAAKLPTNNFSWAEQWNIINGEIQKEFASERYIVIFSKRGSWEFALICDTQTRQVITLIKEDNFKSLQCRKNQLPLHYCDALFYVLNKDIDNDQQRCLEYFEEVVAKKAEEIALTICGDLLKMADQHTLILFSLRGDSISSINYAVIAPDFSYLLKPQSLLKHIPTHYDTPANDVDENNESEFGLKLTDKAKERLKQQDLSPVDETDEVEKDNQK